MRTSGFHKIRRCRGSGEVDNIYTAYNFSHFAIYVIYLPKVIKVRGNLMKFDTDEFDEVNTVRSKVF